MRGASPNLFKTMKRIEAIHSPSGDIIIRPKVLKSFTKPMKIGKTFYSYDMNYRSKQIH